MAYYDASATHFEHQDWMGTERARTSYNGAVEGTYANLPYGDAPTASGADGDAYHYAVFDHDPETGTEHAEFRQYSSTQGRFLSPDPYSGSYNAGNPQSFNRYAYALNSPLSNIDPSGLDCATVQEDGSVVTNTGDCPGDDPNNEYYINCDGCVDTTVTAELGPTGVIIVPLLPGNDLGVSFHGIGNVNYTPGQDSSMPNFTVNFGLSVNYTFFGWFSGTIGAGFVVDSHGNSGTYYDYGGGLGVGAGASAGVPLAGSNGKSICAVGGPFTNVSGTLGAEGAAGTADYFTGLGDGPGGVVRGGGVTVGVGGGASASTTETVTNVTPFGSQTCNQNGKIQ